jgi:hypothetical protein
MREKMLEMGTGGLWPGCGPVYNPRRFSARHRYELAPQTKDLMFSLVITGNASPGSGHFAFPLRLLLRRFFVRRWIQLILAAATMLVSRTDDSRADDLRVEVVKLPALRIQGQLASAHTQGLELAQGMYYVTARRDDVLPKRALLLRTDARGTNWDVWDITPVDARGTLTAFDHPGGMQSDGDRLWIPLAESKRKGSSLIRVFSMAGLVAGQPLKAEFEFPANDHIGAVAVSADHRIVFGANWDTEAVYVWDFDGRLQRTLNGPELESRGLGIVSGANGRAGLAVQDWKVVGDRLFASGLFRGAGSCLSQRKAG